MGASDCKGCKKAGCRRCLQDVCKWSLDADFTSDKLPLASAKLLTPCGHHDRGSWWIIVAARLAGVFTGSGQLLSFSLQPAQHHDRHAVTAVAQRPDLGPDHRP